MKCEECSKPMIKVRKGIWKATCHCGDTIPKKKNKATVIKVDGTEIALSTRPSLIEAQRIVGGFIQLLRVAHGLTLVVDEEGKLNGKPRNARASDYYQLGDLVGDVIVLEGWSTVK